jgi:hypothetical protein
MEETNSISFSKLVKKKKEKNNKVLSHIHEAEEIRERK